MDNSPPPVDSVETYHRERALEFALGLDPGLGHRVEPVGVGHHRCGRIHRKLVGAGGVLVLVVEHLVEGHFLSRVGSVPAHRGNDAGHHAAFHLVVGLVVEDRVGQVLPLVEVGIVWDLRVGRGPEHVFLRGILALVDAGRTAAVAVFGDNRHPLAAVRVAGIERESAVHAAAVEEHLGSVREGVLHRVGIKVLVDPRFAAGGGPDSAAADAVALHGPGVFEPAKVVDVVDVEIAEGTARGPQEAVEPGDLPEQLVGLAGPGLGEGGADHPLHSVAAQQVDLAKLTVLNALVEFLHRMAVPRHEADPDLEVFCVGLLGHLQHAARSRAVCGDRLFHEHVEALLDGVLKVHPAEGERRGKNCDVAGPQRIHGVLVAVEADEAAVFRHVDLVGELRLDGLVAVVELRLEDVRHGDKLRLAGLAERVDDGTGAAAAAADQGDAQLVAALCKDVRHADACERGGAQSNSRGLDEVTARERRRLRGFGHAPRFRIRAPRVKRAGSQERRFKPSKF